MVTMSEKDPETEKQKENPQSRYDEFLFRTGIVARKSVSQELDKFKRRMIRSVARLSYKEKKEDDEVWAELKKETGSECRILWIRMRALTVKKLQRLLLADDEVACIPSVARMNMTDWLLFDLVLVHDKIDVIGRSQESQRESKCLGDLFNLVQRFNIDAQSGDGLLDTWTAAVKFYNKGRMCSPMLLQKRWYQLKEMTRHSFYVYWSKYRGNAKLIERAKPFMPGLLLRAIATRYPYVITERFENWEELINKRKVILPEEFENRGSRDLPNPCSEDDPDLVLLEPHVETIDLGDASDDDTGNSKDKSEIKSKPNESDMKDLEIIKDIEDFNSKIDIKNEPIDIEDNEIEDQLPRSDRLMLHEDEKMHQIENAYITERIESFNKIIVTETEPENTQENAKADDEIDEVPMSPTNKYPESVMVCENTEKSEPTATNKPDEDLNITTETTLDFNDEVANASQSQNTSHTFNDTTETGFETQLPLITNVIGNVDIERGDLSKLDGLNDNAAGITSTALCNNEPQVLEDEDDIIQVNNYDKHNQNVEPETDLVRQLIMSDDKMNEKSNNNSTDSPANKLDIITDVKKSVDEVSIDDDIEFVDDGIVEVDCEDSSSETDKNQEINEDIDNKETSPAFDLKLLMDPVIYTTRLDNMVCLKNKPCDFLLETITVPNILDEINVQSKPKSKKTVEIKVEKEVLKFEPEEDITSTDELFVNKDNTVISDDYDTSSSEELENISEHLKVKRTSCLFKKPVNRQYHPIQLCKNPDFNTRLKRLNIGFYGYTRNIRLLKFCKPVTVDVFKAFEAKLINNTIYLKAEENDDKIAEIISDKENVQVTNITPSAVPVQSLVNSTETDATAIIAEFKALASNPSANDVTEKFEDLPNLPEDESKFKTSIMVDKLVEIKLNNDISVKSQDVSNSTKQENCIDTSVAPKYLKMDKKRSTLSKKYTKIISELQSHTKIMSEFSQKNTKKPTYRPSLERKGAKWLSQGLKPPPPQLDDFLIASDTLTKMLVLMDGGRTFTFKEWSNMKSRTIRNEKSNTNTEPPKADKETSTIVDNRKTKNATKEHSEGDNKCACVACIDNCLCPACQPKENVKLKRINRKKICKSKIAPASVSIQDMSLKSIRKAQALMKKQNTQFRSKGPKSKTTQKITPVDVCNFPDTQETNNQQPVAHIRILPKKINIEKRNSIAVQADVENINEYIQTNNKINLSGNGKLPGDGYSPAHGKVRHIVIDGTKPLISKSTIPNGISNKGKSPIYLGKNKILMTTTKFPPDLDCVKDRKSLPLSYTNLLHPNLQLPVGVNLKISPNGELSFAIDADAVLTAQQHKMLPIFLETMQKLITPSMIVNLNSTKSAKNSSHNSSEEIVISDDEVETLPVISFDGIQENTQIKSHLNQELSGTITAENVVEMQSLRNVSEELKNIENYSEAQRNSDDKIASNDNGQLNSSMIYDEIKKSSNKITVSERNEDSTTNITENSETIAEVIHSNNQETNNYSTSANRKSLLSDLMEMSGISIEDVLPVTVTSEATESHLGSSETTVNVNEIINISAERHIEENEIQQIKAGLPVTEEVNPEGQVVPIVTTVKSLQAELEYTSSSSTNKVVPKMYELNIVSSYAKLKYVCDNNGDFFKLDLDTGFITKINVCIKKKTVVKKTKIACDDPIDLTDEPDSSVDLSESQYKQKKAASTIRVRNNLFPQSDRAKRPPVQVLRQVRKITTLPNIIRKKSILKKNFIESSDLGLVMRRGNTYQTLRARIKKPITNSLDEEIDLVFSDTESDMEPLEEQHLKESDDALENTENIFEIEKYPFNNGSPVVVQSNIDLQSDDDSDDEPLAKKAKRIHRIDDNSDNTTQSREVTTIINPENYPISIINAPINVTIPQIPQINSEVPVLPLPEPMSCEVLNISNPVKYFVAGVVPMILSDDDQNDASASNDEDCILGF